jgi:transcriptional antiterminator RfaH
MSFNWYALRVKPHRERFVYEQLCSKELAAYYPFLKVEPVNPRSRKERPFFPGYLFVMLDLEELGTDALRWMVGTYGLVHIGGEPASVPENLIHELKQRLEIIKAAGGIELAELKQGDRVRIVKGPFDGYEAIFDSRLSGNERVQVLLTFLNDQPKRLQLSASEITKVKNGNKKSGRK